MSDTNSAPIEIDFKKASKNGARENAVSLRTFTSYSFAKNMLIPASPFRFTAPSVDKELRTAIRSGDLATLWVPCPDGVKRQIATGIIDETDTHIIPTQVDYVLSGRDMVGQLVDNSVIDAQNKIINTSNITIDTLLQMLIKNTRIPQEIMIQQIPNTKLLIATNPGETKINALQRYMDYTNCLIWANADGRMILGKPNFAQKRSGTFMISESTPSTNNLLEARVQRNLNHSIREIVFQLQSNGQVDPTPGTKRNNDKDMKKVYDAGVGLSVYRTFTYGSGTEAANTVTTIGNQDGNPRGIGDELSLRDLARENMKVLDIEVVVRGHVNEKWKPYDVDQVYAVKIEDDDVNEDMLVYSCNYELTGDHGMLTRMRLCRLGTIVAYSDALDRTAYNNAFNSRNTA